MREEFKAMGLKPWIVTDNFLIFKNEEIPYSKMSFFNLVTTPTTGLTNGIIQVGYNGKILTLGFPFKDKVRAHSAIDFVKRKMEESSGVVKNYKYQMRSQRGSTIEVYETYLILNFLPSDGLLANIARGGSTGSKKINFSDITAVQFREPAGLAVGFIQFTFPGSGENKGGVVGAVNDENSITVDYNNLAVAREIVAYIEKKREELKTSSVVVQQSVSAADEIKKFKELLDMGVISQEEFDSKKKQLLGI